MVNSYQQMKVNTLGTPCSLAMSTCKENMQNKIDTC